MPTENQKVVVKKIVEKVLKGEKVSVSKVIRESGVYAPSIATHPHKLTESQGYKELMERYLPDEMLDIIHTQLLVSRRLDQIIFPIGAKLTDEEITEMIQDFGCMVRKISRGERAVYVFFYAPDSKARAAALDMAYKRKGRYAPIRIRSEADPLDEISDAELDRRLRSAEKELEEKRRIKKGKNAGKTSKVTT